MLKTFLNIFKIPKYWLTTVILFSLVLGFATVLPNLPLIFDVYSAFGLFSSIKLTISLLGSLSTNFTIYSALSTILIALFFGINVSLFSFYYTQFKDTREKMGIKSSTTGLVLGVLGIGCASCGSLILVSVFSFLGLGGLFALLPFGGVEFAFLGLILLITSTYYLLKKIHNPMVCKI